MLADFTSEALLIEREGFFLTSLQAATQYAVTADLAARAQRCGHCEAAAPSRECRACGRRLCAACDELLHGAGGGGGGEGEGEGEGEGGQAARRRRGARRWRGTCGGRCRGSRVGVGGSAQVQSM